MPTAPNATWILHNYPPVILGGAEFAAHRINLWLLKQGWTITVYILDCGQPTSYPDEFEGVKIVTVRNAFAIQPVPNTFLLSQLWATRTARTLAEMNKLHYIEFVHYVDNTVISPYPWTTRRDFVMVYNSLDTKKRALEIGPWLQDVQSVLMHPIVEPVDPVIRTSFSEYPWITLVNFSEDKGAPVFNVLAAASAAQGKERKFVGIAGSHGKQESPSEHVTMLPATLDMESIWAKTRILVVPSKYETWSMVATEACMRGIPVIAAEHIPALLENCGDGALYVGRENVGAWLEALDIIEANYAYYSEKVLLRKFNPLPALQQIFFS